MLLGHFQSKKILIQKDFAWKCFKVKKCLGKKEYYVKNLVISENNLGQMDCWVKQNFGSKQEKVWLNKDIAKLTFNF